MKRKIEAMHEAYGTSPNLCKYCEHFWVHIMPSGRRYFKCHAYGESRSEATEWRANWTACGLFNRPLPPLFVPMIEELKHAERKKPEEPLQGQIGLEDLT